ncbi:MAG: isoprenylcysteine carboxylmethyltransferase family protein [Deltaproteobacteria bacterium]
MNLMDYFQIITLIIFLLIFSGRSLQLARKGTPVFHLGSGKKGLSALLERSFLIFFPLWLLEIAIHSLHLNLQFLPEALVNPLFKNHVLGLAGAALILTSLLVFSLALIFFKSSWRVGIDTVSPGGLITTGVFSVSRNPIFLSMNLFFLGTFFIFSNVFFLLSFVGMAFGFHVQIRQEEAFLSKEYGAGYCEYMTQVRRYI